MTVKELKELLTDMNDDTEVIMELNGKYFEVKDSEKNHITNELIIKLSK